MKILAEILLSGLMILPVQTAFGGFYAQAAPVVAAAPEMAAVPEVATKRGEEAAVPGVATERDEATAVIRADGNAPESPADTTLALEGVVVSGSRVPLALGKSARMVTVLDSVTISSAPVHTVNDLLKYAAGVDVRQRGVAGMQTDISVRGGTFDQIAILLNGVNISDPQTGHNGFDLPVDMSDIERIEVLEGPAARVYGTQSLVGAINIVTKNHDGVAGTGAGSKAGVSAHMEGGSYGTFSAGAGVHASKNGWSGQISMNGGRSDGYLRSKAGSLNSDYKYGKAFMQGGYSGEKFDVNAYLGASIKGFGSNTFYSSKFDDQFEHTAKTYAAIQGQTHGRLQIKPVLYWNYGYDRFELFRGAPEKYPFNYHRTNTLGANLGASYDWAWGKTAFGMELRNEDIVSTNLGEPLDEPKGDHFVCGLNRTNLSFYLEHNLVLNRFTISGGLSASHNSGDNHDGFRIYPGLDASLRLGAGWKLYASYNSSWRMPTFTELYYSVGGHKADKHLSPERMQAVEGGVKYIIPGFDAVASVYYHHGSNMIDWIRDTSLGDNAVWTSVNHTDINTFGQELTLRFDFPVLLGRSDMFLRTFDLSYSHISQDKDAGDGFQSLYALEYLKNKMVAEVGFHIVSDLFLKVSGRYVDREGNYDPYFLLDAKLSWERPSWRLYVEGNNLTDKTYYDHGDIPQPGLWVLGGIAISL